MARPLNRQETRTLALSVPAALHEYLCYLATHTQLGASENAVTLWLLTQSVIEVQKSGFHGLRTLPLIPMTAFPDKSEAAE